MCQFKSAIVLRDKTAKGGFKLLLSPWTESHSELIIIHKLRDDGRLRFARVEFSPPSMDSAHLIEGYKLKIDEERTPEWFNSEMKDAVADKLRTYVKGMIVTGDVQLLIGGQFIVAPGAKIECAHSMVINAVCGGTISEVRGGTISAVCGGTISEVCGGTISEVRGGTISEVRGGTISEVCGGTISVVRGGTISAVRGGTISAVCGGTISAVCGGTISAVWGGTISAVCGGTISEVRGGTISAVCGGTISAVCGGTISEVRGGTISVVRKFFSGLLGPVSGDGKILQDNRTAK
jgi:hypothetical protein